MELTRKQDSAIKLAVKRFNSKEKYTTIAGYAGTGKTFIAKQIIDALGLNEEEYLVGTFTGKAAFKLQQSGFENAKTLHKIRYRSFKIDDKWIHMKHSPAVFIGIKVILVDEVSMVPKKILDDIFELENIHVIMLGDPGQLPPVGADNKMLLKPHIFLDEIMRQEGESGIVRLASAVREGEIIINFKDPKVRIITLDELDENELARADQILCGRNNTRRKINELTRSLKGYKFKKPEKTDKMIVLNNRWDLCNEAGMPLINGMLGTAIDVGPVNEEWEAYGEAMGGKLKVASIKIKPETDNGLFEFDYDTLPFYSKGMRQSEQFDLDHRFTTVDFGYAITVHKSQGSEYNNVIGFEEKLTNVFHRRWLYTMITRSKDKLTIIKDPKSIVFS